MTIKFDNVTTKESSKTDNGARSTSSANMTITVDPEKFKPILKQILAAQGLPTDDATIDAMLSAMSGQLVEDADPRRGHRRRQRGRQVADLLATCG